MFDAQVYYARDDIGKDHRKRCEQTGIWWREREEGLEDDEQVISFQGDYVQALTGQTDFPSFEVVAVNKIFLE